MKRGNGSPTLYNADQLKWWLAFREKPETGAYVMARPLGFYGICLRKRLKLSWGVFTGKYDALKWDEQ